MSHFISLNFNFLIDANFYSVYFYINYLGNLVFTGFTVKFSNSSFSILHKV